MKKKKKTEKKKNKKSTDLSKRYQTSHIETESS